MEALRLDRTLQSPGTLESGEGGERFKGNRKKVRACSPVLVSEEDAVFGIGPAFIFFW